MKKDRFGSLFEEIRSKSPDMLDKLMGIADRNSNTPKSEVTPEQAESKKAKLRDSSRKLLKDHVENVLVEKGNITTKPQGKKPNQKSASKPEVGHKKSKAKIISSAGKFAPSYPESFFEGIPENAHQFDHNDSSKILDVVIGLDFGTSSTKVVVQVPHSVGSPAFAIPFGKYAHESLEYLLPTKLAVNSNGRCSFTTEADSSILTDIKVSLMDSDRQLKVAFGEMPPGATSETATAAYLALALRYVRSWFLTQKKAIFQGFKINWAINLGLPAAIDDDKKLRERFDLVGKAAWLLSRKSGSITLESARQNMEKIRQLQFEEDELPWDFALVPEVIAEVTGYARSEFRNEGLHFLVDIGASTLDVCGFTLRDKEGDDHFTIYTAEVAHLGAQRLHSARIQGAQEATSKNAKGLVDAKDPLSCIPNDLKAYAPDGGLIVEGVKKASEEFQKECNSAIRKTIWHIRKKRDPNSPDWSSNLLIFMCGGAREVDLYRQVIQGIEAWLHEFIPSCPGVRIIPILKPKSLQAESDNTSYHRLAVAWGLSHESFNIGTYDRPNEIDDVPPPQRRDFSDRFIGSEMT